MKNDILERVSEQRIRQEIAEGLKRGRQEANNDLEFWRGELELAHRTDIFESEVQRHERLIRGIYEDEPVDTQQGE